MIDKSYKSVSDYSNELDKIVYIVKQLRQMKTGSHTHWSEAAEWHMKYSNLHGSPALALTITLSPTGCEWAKQGGCTMCGEFEGSYKQKDLLDTPQFHISQFAAAVSSPKVWNTVKTERCPLSWIRINQEGNFSNCNEMNRNAQEIILRLAMRITGIKRITIESRPQYLDKETVEFFHSIFRDSDVELEIGMGLEAEDDIVRNICINKQGSREQFKHTVALLKQYNIHPLAYVLLKPPFLTEQEAINEAVDTLHFAANIGFERISLEPLSIHQYTLVDVLKEAGIYQAPWLWSVVEVAKQCKDISSIFGIGGVGYYPIPSEYAHNYCTGEHDCNEKVISLIKAYNMTRDVSVFDSINCTCMERWREICSISDVDLRERIKCQIFKAEKVLSHYSPQVLTQDVSIRSSRIINGGSQ